jgi:hypothetical protein
VSNKDTIIEALTMQLKLEREGNLALVNRIAELERQEPLVWMNKYGHVASFKNDEYTAPLYIRPVVHAVRCTYPQCQATNGCVGACSKGQAEKQEPVVYQCPKCKHVHASDISQERVDETAKHRHEWVEQPDLARVGEVGVWGDKREWVGLATGEAREFYESDLSREELIHKIDEFLQEKNT